MIKVKINKNNIKKGGMPVILHGYVPLNPVAESTLETPERRRYELAG